MLEGLIKEQDTAELALQGFPITAGFPTMLLPRASKTEPKESFYLPSLSLSKLPESQVRLNEGIIPTFAF